ncbi:Ig-like domain-containing protein, partial [bacterium]|nr:Ig-like domain-containing protein [bacterium]
MFTTKKTGIFATLLLALGLMLGVTVTGCTDEDRDRPDAPAAADVTAYVLPEGYVVGEDEEGNSAILNADGEVVPAAELPAECDINPGESQNFVVIGGYTTDNVTTYVDVTDKCEAELQVATQEELITNELFTVNVDENAQPEESAAQLSVVPTEGLEEATIVAMTINVAGAEQELTVEADVTEIEVDGVANLTVTYNEEDVTADCTFESSDEEIATVDEAGVVTGVADGVATITASYIPEGAEEALTGDIDITVGAVVGGLILTADPEEIAVDETSQLTAMYGTEDVTADCTFETSDEAIATVDETGLVTGVAEGEVTITATYEAEGEEEPAVAEVTITVGGAGEALTVEADATEIEVGGEANLTVTYNEADVTADCTFESSDEAIATVDAGVVTGVAEGEVTITATYVDPETEEELT